MSDIEAAESLAAEAMREGLAACRHLRGVVAGLRTQTADLLRAVRHRDRRVARLTRERDAAHGEIARLRAALAETAHVTDAVREYVAALAALDATAPESDAEAWTSCVEESLRAVNDARARCNAALAALRAIGGAS